ncbi:preprotein translocase subunit SecE [uncultured Algimonas sp.]|uniref:preprotein translocase subunit SecE n=1 Tax=uncultured Algimonas sp. TaxID=1547920 RepID=UPI00261FEEE4|nr:preprotein translocase subunit SecE [uncultured Algimonas sp.]
MAKGKSANPSKKGADMAPKVSPATYLAQVQQEGRKVVWPSWKETRQTTILVMICVILFGLFFFAVDFLIGIVVPWVLSFGSAS